MTSVAAESSDSGPRHRPICPESYLFPDHVGWFSEREQALIDRRIGLLNHEERYVLEDVAKVQSIAATQNVLTLTGEVVGKADARLKSWLSSCESTA